MSDSAAGAAVLLAAAVRAAILARAPRRTVAATAAAVASALRPLLRAEVPAVVATGQPVAPEVCQATGKPAPPTAPNAGASPEELVVALRTARALRRSRRRQAKRDKKAECAPDVGVGNAVGVRSMDVDPVGPRADSDLGDEWADSESGACGGAEGGGGGSATAASAVASAPSEVIEVPHRGVDQSAIPPILGGVVLGGASAAAVSQCSEGALAFSAGLSFDQLLATYPDSSRHLQDLSMGFFAAQDGEWDFSKSDFR